MANTWDSYLQEKLIDEEQLQTRIKGFGAQISQDYKSEDLVLLCGLKGGVFVRTDLRRQITIPNDVDFLAVSSYGKNVREATGVVRIVKDLDEPIDDRHVLIVEDIIDSGYTLDYITRNLKTRNPASLKICTLLDKKERREVDIPIDYTGFEIADKFVFGYGLDLDEKFRELPFIGVVKPGLFA